MSGLHTVLCTFPTLYRCCIIHIHTYTHSRVSPYYFKCLFMGNGLCDHHVFQRWEKPKRSRPTRRMMYGAYMSINIYFAV